MTPCLAPPKSSFREWQLRALKTSNTSEAANHILLNEGCQANLPTAGGGVEERVVGVDRHAKQ